MENAAPFPALVRDAETAIRDLFEPTPLQRNDHLSARFGADIWLKREDLTPVRSYKLRGAFNAMRKRVAPGQATNAHFVCASAGNHAQGVAYACRHFGARGTIFMPVTTPRQKIDKTKVFGGDAIEIILTGDYFDQTLAASKTFAAEHGAQFLAPFDSADVIEGQATVALEMLEQLGEAPDLVVLMGNIACDAGLGRRGILRLRGNWTTAFDRPALPMTHPAYLLRNPPAKREAWADLLSLSARLEGQGGR